MIIVGSYYFCIIIDNYVSTFSLFSATIFTQQKAEAQAYLQTIKYRNLVIDLDNGVKPMLSYLYLPLAMSHFTAALLISDSGSSLWRDYNGLKYWSQEKKKYSGMLVEGGSKKLRKHKKEYPSY